VVLNSAFASGNAFLTIATDPYLSRIPLILTAPPEYQMPDKAWSTNAYSGAIMNNYVAKRLGRHLFLLGGWADEAAYAAEFRRLLRVVYAVKEARREVVGRLGDAPGGFHSATGDQLAYARLFGTRIETVDLSAVMETYRTGRARGPLGETGFADQDVEATFRLMTSGVEVDIESEFVRRAARLYHASKALIEVNGFTTVTFRCWPEMMQPYIGVSPCFTIGWLQAQRVILAAGCEGDWPAAVMLNLGALLSGQPTACVDLVNQVGAGPVVQLGHCGIGIRGLMAHERIADKIQDRSPGVRHGPTNIGQFAHGLKTGFTLMQAPDGGFRMLAFTGTNSAETDQHLYYCAADLAVPDARALGELIVREGFPHHVGMAFGDITPEFKLLCDFHGIRYLSPEASGTQG
jgi:L-fucose isomerase-like protein